MAGLAVIASSCSVVRHGTAETKSMIQSLAGANKGGATNTVAALQGEVMREADQYVGAVAQAADDFREQVGTTTARNEAQRWKLNEATIAYVNAAGENPVINAVSLAVLASLSRYVVEDYWVGEKFGDAARPLLETHRRLESNVWSLVQGVLTPDQQQELRNFVGEFREKHPRLRYVSAVRLPELVATLGKNPSPEQTQRPGSLFSLLYINPLAGLDPTTQAIEQTRMLAQRAMYYAQRAPMLLGWQVELTIYQLAAQPETKQLLADVNDVAESTKVFAKTVGQLPQLVNDQREAAINQLLAGVASERSNILATLVAQEAQLRELLPQVQQTLDAGADMARSVNGAVQSLDAFVRYVSPPDTNPPTAGTNGPPFNILDYGTAAGQIGAAARDLNTLLLSLNQTVPRLEQLTAGADVRRRAARFALPFRLVTSAPTTLTGSWETPLRPLRTLRALGVGPDPLRAAGRILSEIRDLSSLYCDEQTT